MFPKNPANDQFIYANLVSKNFYYHEPEHERDGQEEGQGDQGHHERQSGEESVNDEPERGVPVRPGRIHPVLIHIRRYSTHCYGLVRLLRTRF